MSCDPAIGDVMQIKHNEVEPGRQVGELMTVRDIIASNSENTLLILSDRLGRQNAFFVRELAPYWEL